MREIPLSVPNLSAEITDNLRECIETGWVSTGGRFIGEFEKKVADYTGVADAVSTQSGTAGLHLALQVLGVRPGDEIIVPTLTFIAAVNSVKYVGAEPMFLDCDDSLCIDPVKLEQFCRSECDLEGGYLYHRTTGKRIPALILVHVFGNLADMKEIMRIARNYHFKVIEDATEALGSYYDEGSELSGKFAGTVGDMGVYSFNANKIITTGGGGMLVSTHQEYLDQARYLSLTAKNDSLFFVHDEVGFNYRMLNLQAALGVSQIDQLENFIEVKKRNYYLYQDLLSGISGITLYPFRESIRSNYWFYSLMIDEEQLGISRNDLMHALIDQGIQCRPVWKLIHTQLPYQENRAYQIEQAYKYERSILNVPCSTSLTAEDVEYVCEKIIEVIKKSR
ncbi:MAG: LegC family aminotransferase [Paenibacillus sp.]|nr:LegC family aminotransferase [Paenibacillus sp.]